MSKKQTNYIVVGELLSFASATEGDLGSLSDEEVNERLMSQGIDPQVLDKSTNKRLQIIRNKLEAAKAAEQASIKFMRASAPIVNGVAFAARADSITDSEDLEILKRFAQPDVKDDGTEN